MEKGISSTSSQPNSSVKPPQQQDKLQLWHISSQNQSFWGALGPPWLITSFNICLLLIWIFTSFFMESLILDTPQDINKVIYQGTWHDFLAYEKQGGIKIQSTRLSQNEFKPLFISCFDLMNRFNTFVCLTGLVNSQHMNLFSCTLQQLFYCCTKGIYSKGKKYQKST